MKLILRIAAAASTLLVIGVLAPNAFAQIDYWASIGDDFKADFVDLGAGPQPDPTTPQFGANDEWEFLAVASEDPPIGGTITSVPGGMPASGQAGWCAGDGTSCITPAFYTYFANEAWQPGITISSGFGGHGPQSLTWTAPASVDAGTIDVSGAIEQLFEAQRRMRLEVSGPSGSFFVDAEPPTVNGVILNRVDFGPSRLAVSPGDVVTFDLVPSGDESLEQGGVPTFTFVGLEIHETPEPGSAVLFALGAAMTAVLSRRRRT